MNFFGRYFKSLFFSKRFYWTFAIIISLFVFGYLSVVLFWIAKLVLLVFFLFVIIDYIVLYSKTGITAERTLPDRLSNGDENNISIHLNNKYSFKTLIRIIDELPVQFQKRDFELDTVLKQGEHQDIKYSL